MTLERIECANDARAAVYREIGDGELLRARGVFVAEGRLVVRRVIEDARWAIESVLVNEAAFSDLAGLLDRLAPDVQVLVCRTSGFEELTGFNIHRGCLALVRRPPPLPLAALVVEATLLVVLEAVTNADNV